MAHDRKRQAALAQTRQSMIGTGNIMSQTLREIGSNMRDDPIRLLKLKTKVSRRNWLKNMLHRVIRKSTNIVGQS